MAFTTASEIAFINQVFDRIQEGQITLADQTSPQALAAYRCWTLTLNSLIRSYQWPFLTTRTELYQIKTLLLDTQPSTSFAAGDTLTGISSGNTAYVISSTNDTEYVLGRLTGDFEDGEEITNGTVNDVFYQGVQVYYNDEEVKYFDKSSSDMAVSDLTLTVLAPSFKWAYQYMVPSDFKRLVEIYEDDGTDQPYDRWDYENGRILTDYSTCNIRYIKTVSDPDDFDDLFAEVLLLRLAWKLIPPLAGKISQSDKDEIWRDLQTAERKARTICAEEDNKSGRSDWNLARYGV